MSRIDVGLKEFVLAEGGFADCALVGEVGRLQGLLVVLRHVIQKLPLVNLKINQVSGVTKASDRKQT